MKQDLISFFIQTRYETLKRFNQFASENNKIYAFNIAAEYVLRETPDKILE